MLDKIGQKVQEPLFSIMKPHEYTLDKWQISYSKVNVVIIFYDTI